jgi:glyoxylate reductase
MSDPSTVFVSGTFPGDAVAFLRESFEVVQDDRGVASPAFAECADRVRGILALVADRIDRALLARTPKLAVIGNVAVGVDNVDLAATAERGIIVTNTPDVLTEATADLAMGLLIAAARRMGEGERLLRAGEFGRWTPTYLLGRPVHGMNLGIVGLGRIGKAVARRARGFGMHIGYTQRKREDEGIERALGVTWVPSLDELCQTSNAITIHCPLNAESRLLFSRERLAKMRPGSVLVNTARGPIVDEAALADALEHGPLAAAGIDVFENEPAVHPKLLARENAVLTPHIGSADLATREAMIMLAATNVHRVLHGQLALTPINR